MSPGCDTASLMVAVPSESTGKLSNSQLANLISQTASQAKSQMPSWRPRDGRNDAYLKWHSALTTFEHDLGIDIDAVIPAISELIEMIPYILTKGPVTEHDHEMLNAFQAARQEWIEQNEALFNVIRSSLDLDGPSLERDLRTLASLMGSTKDGRAIRKWALGFADVSTVSTQADLQAKLDVKLPKSATLSELETHSAKMWSSWLLISGNDADSIAKLESFHYRWLNSLPSEPVGSHLASVRKWLADKISERSAILHNVDSAIDIMVKYAASIGLTNTITDPKHHNASAAFALFGPKNKCNFCKANSCQSEDHGGPTECISRWDSSVPISKVIGNLDNEAMVLALREHHKNNKDAANLKGIYVDFEPCKAKVKALLNAKPASEDACDGKQVTPILSASECKFVTPVWLKSEVTDQAAFERWLNGHTGGSASGTTINVIGEHAMVSLPPKSPHMARWQRLLKDFRGSNHEPYTPYTGQMITMLDNPMPNG